MNRSAFLFPAACVLVIACLAAWLPVLVGPYGLALLINLGMYVALATAWVIFSGPTRYASLATVAFFGLGAYVMAIFAETQHPIIILAITIGVSGICALIVGAATLRLSGVHFVIFTFGLSELVRQLTIWSEANFAGTVGRYVFLDISQEQIFWQLIVLTVVLFLIGYAIQASRLGWALRAIGEDETAARHMGIDTTQAKLTAFVLSAVAMAVAGMIIAPRWTYIDPTIAFNPVVSFQVLIMALLGGTTRLYGPLLGVVPLVFIFEFLQANFPSYFSILLGLIFLGAVYFLPHGVVGLLQNLSEKRPGKRTQGLEPAE